MKLSFSRTVLSSKMTSDGDTGFEINVRIFMTGEAGQCYGLGGKQKLEEVAASSNGVMTTKA